MESEPAGYFSLINTRLILNGLFGQFIDELLLTR
jgi:hypothetical protein